MFCKKKFSIFILQYFYGSVFVLEFVARESAGLEHNNNNIFYGNIFYGNES